MPKTKIIREQLYQESTMSIPNDGLDCIPPASLIRYLEGNLDTRQRKNLCAHIIACDACASLSSSMAQYLPDIGTPVQVSSHKEILRNLKRRIGDLEREGRRRPDIGELLSSSSIPVISGEGKKQSGETVSGAVKPPRYEAERSQFGLVSRGDLLALAKEFFPDLGRDMEIYFESFGKLRSMLDRARKSVKKSSARTRQYLVQAREEIATLRAAVSRVINRATSRGVSDAMQDKLTGVLKSFEEFEARLRKVLSARKIEPEKTQESIKKIEEFVCEADRVIRLCFT